VMQGMERNPASRQQEHGSRGISQWLTMDSWMLTVMNCSSLTLSSNSSALLRWLLKHEACAAKAAPTYYAMLASRRSSSYYSTAGLGVTICCNCTAASRVCCRMS
jgi:hypothetical protein